VGPKTLEGYEAACRVHIIPALGHIRLGDLRSRQVQGFYADKMREGLGIRTRRNIHASLKRALKQAVVWGELASNPAESLVPPKASFEEESEEIRALTNEETGVLFAAVRERGDRFRNLYIAAVRTGLRQGELLGLKWEDLNLDTSPASVTLRRSLASKIGGGFYFTPTKRKSQRRRLALLDEAAAALRAQRELQDDERRTRRWRENGLVFPSTIGTPMNARNLYARNFQPTLSSTGLPDISFHDLRHSFATIMLFEWGVHVKYVSEMLEHADPTITLNIYSHLLEGSHEVEVRRLNQVLSDSRRVG
jgi:integrase